MTSIPIIDTIGTKFEVPMKPNQIGYKLCQVNKEYSDHH